MSKTLTHFFFSSRRRHTMSLCDWSSDVCSSDLVTAIKLGVLMIKLGQFLSSRADLLPEQALAALSSLQDEVPPAPFSHVEIGRASCRERCRCRVEQAEWNSVTWDASVGPSSRRT